MDAVKFLKEAERKCLNTECSECELKDVHNVVPCKFSSVCMELKEPEKLVEIIEKWAAEHPVKTRQSEFLKMFPSAKMLNGVISVDPCEVDTENCGVDSESEWCQKCDSCESCHKDYWLTEVE